MLARLKQFDKNGDKRLNAEERKAAREFLKTDAANCGYCNTPCSTTNSTNSCSNGTCVIFCIDATKYANCNDDPDDGCETDVRTDKNNCGGCDIVCSGQNIPQVTCADSNCNGACATNYDDLLTKDPRRAVEKAVWGMLPKNRIARQQLKKLKVYAGPEHPHKAQQPVPFEITQVAQ